MSKVDELKGEIERLPKEEFTELLRWLSELELTKPALWAYTAGRSRDDINSNINGYLGEIGSFTWLY